MFLLLAFSDLKALIEFPPSARSCPIYHIVSLQLPHLTDEKTEAIQRQPYLTQCHKASTWQNQSSDPALLSQSNSWRPTCLGLPRIFCL